MKKEVKQWLSNSKLIAANAGDSFRSKFNYEIQKRNEAVATFRDQIIAITPNIVAGTYCVIGQNPDDDESCYIGNVDIFIESSTWRAEWNISGYVHSAYGMLVAPNMLVFNYSYNNSEGNKKSGIVAYTFLSFEIVKGSWLEDGFPTIGIEELRKLGADEDNKPDSHDANLGFSMN